jgi:hypothetical protein
VLQGSGCEGSPGDGGGVSSGAQHQVDLFWKLDSVASRKRRLSPRGGRADETKGGQPSVLERLPVQAPYLSEAARHERASPSAGGRRPAGLPTAQGRQSGFQEDVASVAAKKGKSEDNGDVGDLQAADRGQVGHSGHADKGS